MLSVCVPNASQSHARAISQKGLRTPQRLLSYFCLAGLFALALGCSSDPVKQEITRVASPIDMTGHWEMDYAKSDNLQDQLNAVARQIRREAARREQLAKEGRGFAGGPLPGRRDLYGTISIENDAALVTGVIDESMRGKGLGRKLFSSLVDEGKKICDTVLLEVLITNQPAQNLYNSLGFVETSRTDKVINMELRE